MHAYRAEIIADVPTGWTCDDVLARAVQAVDAVTIVDDCNVVRVPGELISIRIDYQGLNDHEALRTARIARDALNRAADVAVRRWHGRSLRRI